MNSQHNNLKQSLSGQRGFTLLEILIAVSIVGGITFFIGLFGNDALNYSLRFNNSLLTQQEIQQTLQIMIPEIRSAAQSNNGIYPIEEATSTSFIFYSDIDLNGTFDRVRYFVSGNTFKKGVTKPTGSPLAYVTSTEALFDEVHGVVTGSPIFTYYGVTATSTNSVALTAPVDVLKVKMVKISLIADQSTKASVHSYVGVENQATIRNLRYK